MVESIPEGDEAFASISLNPAVTWTKFILTDDKPNANKKRVPTEEFDNLIKTGVFMPIKMAEGQINDGHEESRPIGVITHLKKFKDQIVGLAALWKKENPEDVELVKKYYDEKRPLQLSWEILYANSSTSEDGVEDLLDTVLRAVTLVGMPAYAGRTPILEVSAQNKNLEDESMDELEKLQKEVADLKASLVDTQALLTAKETELSTISAERDSLAQFKAAIDKEKEDAEKLNAIMTLFKEAGIEKDTEYFDKNKGMFLSMAKEEVDFFVQELVSFKSASASDESGDDGDKNGVPPIPPKKDVKYTPKELADMLKSLESKK